MVLIRVPKKFSWHLCYLSLLILSLLGFISVSYKLPLFKQTEPQTNLAPTSTHLAPTSTHLIQTKDIQTPAPTDPTQIKVTQTILSDNQTLTDECRTLCPFSTTFTNVTLQFNSSHIIRHFPHFVCPQNFRNLADWVYDWPNQFHENVQVTTKQGKQIAPCLPSGSIIYVRQWAVDKFFAQIYPHLQNNFVLITGEADTSSPTHLEKLEASDSKIIHWFGQNGQYHVSKTNKFTHIPIGYFFLYPFLFVLCIF